MGPVHRAKCTSSLETLQKGGKYLLSDLLLGDLLMGIVGPSGTKLSLSLFFCSKVEG